MLTDERYSGELNTLLENIHKKNKKDGITSKMFILSVIETKNTLAYEALDKNMFDEGFATIKDICSKNISKNIVDNIDVMEFGTIMESLKENITDRPIFSSDVLLRILRSNEDIMSALMMTGTTYDQVRMTSEDITGSATANVNDFPIKHKKPQTTNNTPKTKIDIRRLPDNNEKGDVERYLTSLNDLAEQGKIENVIGNDKVYDMIFRNLSKRDRSNIVVIGKPGVGKTATIKNIANLIVSGAAPKMFRDKKLMLLDFTSLLIGTAYRGGLEAKLNSIVTDASKKGKYIFFVDDIHSVIANGRYGEMGIETVFEPILSNRNILFICTCTNEGYSKYIQAYPFFTRRMNSIELDEKDIDSTVEIISSIKSKYESFHHVTYDNDVIIETVKLAKKYIANRCLPDSAIDILDEAGAVMSLQIKDSEQVSVIRKRLAEIMSEKDSISRNTGSEAYEKYDTLVREEITLRKKLEKAEKEELKSISDKEVDISVIKSIISEKTGTTIEDIDNVERNKLKKLYETVSGIVIGQDDAVSKVCRAVRRQRVGIANPNKPCVLMFCGSTGTGKTYLAKTLAKEVFGNENKLVRIDMSEYADKTSINKLYGSSAGYVGYDDGGVLTEAVKKHKSCVLLLDEIEKASDDVFNVFLQVFDEGRLTDNKGFVVDFKNTIIIMTSNIGSKELAENGKGIGFVKGGDNERSLQIIKAAVKKRFKPEFVNRIDDIVMFNNLTEDNIRNIITLEIEKVNKRVVDMGYSLAEDIKKGKLVNIILDNIRDESEYGARPVLREVQHVLEDGITDFVIDNNPEKGYEFTLEDILKEGEIE